MNDKFLVITVDTESDWFDMAKNKITSVAGLPFLQDLCAQCEMIPTYLVTYEMASREESIRVIKKYLDLGLCEVGHHLHIWSTPPFENCNSYGVDEKWIGGIQSEISDDIFEKKMKSLHNAIEKNFNIKPTSHRAGRWAIDKRTLIWLEKNEYLVDTSICPYQSWIDTKGVNDYIKTDTFCVPNTPYFPDYKDITKKAQKKENTVNIVEVPVTGIKGDIFTKIKLRGINMLRLILNELGYSGIRNMSFRPSYKEPLKVFEKITHEIFQSDIPLINFMFHSSELTLGTSPYSINQNRLDLVKKKIIFALKTAKEYELKGIALSKTAAYFNSSNS